MIEGLPSIIFSLQIPSTIFNLEFGMEWPSLAELGRAWPSLAELGRAWRCHLSGARDRHVFHVAALRHGEDPLSTRGHIKTKSCVACVANVLVLPVLA